MRKFTPAAALAVLFCAGAPHAIAGVTPPVISGTYYEQNGTQGCSQTPGSSGGGASSSGGVGASTCAVLFQAPPAGKQLALGSVACKIQTAIDYDGEIQEMFLAQNVGGSISRQRYLDFQLRSIKTAKWYVSDTVLDGNYLVVAPVRVVVNLSSSSVIGMDCQITGTLRSTPAP